MGRSRSGRRIRFNAKSSQFTSLASEYRAALRRAEMLWKALQRPGLHSTPAKADRLRRELALVEDRLDAARSALLNHTRVLAADPMRTHVKNLGLASS